MIPSTPDELYEQLLDKKEGILTEAAHNLLREAQGAAYATNLADHYCFQPEEYDEAMEKMDLAAKNLTGQDRKILAEVVHLGRLAARSIDPDDTRPAGYRVDRGDLHYYYVMVSDMIKRTLRM